MSEKDYELYLYSLRKMAEEKVENNRTFMTDLYNLRAFHYKAAEEMLQYPELKFAVIIMDFANFKSINEFCGRDAGDGLLKCVADAFRENTGSHVILSHFRADIFGMLTPYKTEQDLIEIVRRIDKRIMEHKIPYKVLPAFGICIADGPTMSISLMCDYAAMALNTIKGKFYAKYAFFDEKMRQSMLMEKMIENNIVEALVQNQLCLYIQPKVDMRTKKIIGGEALVRWHHPERGIVAPGQFIPVLEKNGLINDVDWYIWEQVYKLLGRRVEQGKRVVPVSINISRTHAFDEMFTETMLTLSKEYGVSPELVPLELTESGFLESTETIYDELNRLKANGFILSMDDFGTGYSTMTMLKNQPVDEIKIDRGFIIDIKNQKSRNIISHTIEMLKDLEVDMITEGVETEEQQNFLLECGCTKAQGFLYYKPMLAEEFGKLLDTDC